MQTNLFFYKVKYLFPILLLGLVIGLIFFRPYWFPLAIIIIILGYILSLKLISIIKNARIRKAVKIVFYFLFIFIMSSAIKSFVLGIYIIPSNSMENTLIPGDVVLVNKLVYGPKLPRSPFEISWVDILFSMNDKARESIKKHWWSYKRLSGTDYMNQGDVLIYELSQGFFVVKRCVAIAGDTLTFTNGELSINKEEYVPSSAIKNPYRLKVKSIDKLRNQIDSLGIKEKIKYFNNKKYDEIELILSYKEHDKLKVSSNLENTERAIDTFNLSKEVSVFSTDDTNYTLDNMGPLIVPKNGMKIYMNANTYNMYRKVLIDHEKVTCTEVDGEYYINNLKINHYIFGQDYCFVMGDNRRKSIDSRYVGFIPEENIVGKVQSVLFSSNDNEFRWDRLFKSVN